MLKLWERTTVFLKNHPRISVYGIGAMTLGISAHQYMTMESRKLERATFKKMEMGSRPCIPHSNPSQMISRGKATEEIVNLFFPHPQPVTEPTTAATDNLSLGKGKGFGMIVGPTGTGKTALITRACNKFPKGVLYVKVCEPAVFDRDLAKEMLMKINPSNIFDLFLGYFSSDNFLYYHLPEEQDKAMDVIFKVLEETATKYKSKYGKIPTLFIDGADVLAKYQEDLFKHVVHHAKVLANAKVLTVVFVSSEGSILPVVQSLSEISRSTKLYVTLSHLRSKGMTVPQI